MDATRAMYCKKNELEYARGLWIFLSTRVHICVRDCYDFCWISYQCLQFRISRDRREEQRKENSCMQCNDVQIYDRVHA